MPKKKVKEEVIEEVEVVEEEVEAVVEEAEEVKAPKKAAKKEEISPKLVTEAVKVCKDENGLNGKEVQGIVSEDGKSVTTLEGVTYAL
jgi:hypothetical protein